MNVQQKTQKNSMILAHTNPKGHPYNMFRGYAPLPTQTLFGKFEPHPPLNKMVAHRDYCRKILSFLVSPPLLPIRFRSGVKSYPPHIQSYTHAHTKMAWRNP